MSKHMVFNEENHLRAGDSRETLCGLSPVAFTGIHNPSLRDCPECLAQRIVALEGTLFKIAHSHRWTTVDTSMEEAIEELQTWVKELKELARAALEPGAQAPAEEA